MKQLNLFVHGGTRSGPPTKQIQAKARKSDPNASQVAAQNMNATDASGVSAAEGHRQRIVQALRLIPASTPGEIGKYLNAVAPMPNGKPWDSVKISKRMSELRDAGLAVSFGERICSVNLSICGVWVLTSQCCASEMNQERKRCGTSPGLAEFEEVRCNRCKKNLGKRRCAI